MKKLIFISTLILFTGISFGQVLPKGTRIGIHVMAIELQPGVTMEQFIQFYSDKVLVEWNKIMSPDIHRYLVKGLRGEFADRYCMIAVIKSEEAFAKYYNSDLSQTELNKSIREKIKPFEDELKKLGTYKQEHFTQWEVQ